MGWKGFLRDTGLSVFNFRDQWKYEIKIRELWMFYFVSFRETWTWNFHHRDTLFLLFNFREPCVGPLPPLALSSKCDGIFQHRPASESIAWLYVELPATLSVLFIIIIVCLQLPVTDTVFTKNTAEFYNSVLYMLGIEIVCVRPSKGLDRMHGIKTLNDVSKKNTCARSGEM